MNELTIIKNDQAVTSSLIVAEQFGKRHDHVLRDIDDIKGVTQNWGDLFQEETYIHPQNKQEYRMYYMNRDGFSLLAMGFTGAKALTFKLNFINAFNQMETELNSPEKIMARALRIADQTINQLQLETKVKDQQIAELKPKADYYDDILKNKGLVTISQIAKDYGMSGQEMNRTLKNLGVQYKQSEQWLMYSKHQDKGYTHSETVQITHTDGRADVRMITKWTQKGRIFLYGLLKDNGILPVIEREDH
ncbi:phage regulatory protein/antirepressor Ant [Proteiniclasticum sp. QWL-01]|uniref:Rha family transcriptional regulator n=1 Tax=Proteiniclasticum sp. QWL-01 TaxID=3036945 RepID=UPI002410BBB4|nr:phage regulatory protein/antirepressor Ant [Proteiniclasticum sp. QWL-01]WFF73979.1 phage regulatory protein/antirepressor Ant [Proteiniclasticum sp. QWL-01]